ncbi:hypothetical protein [Paracidovorax valerianellae]|uniref:hypothetical protein n=1 Tax=Paracidovorax valerianellae TaxID=187868 RepID=UPI002304CC4E|nr:hypothetical protein [Paracidovorax valerianellae]MDA8446265.1 hypothetical protein [Paracidovorax valerianellae]
MNQATREPTPMELHNTQLMEQIQSQLKSGFDAALQGGDYYVVRSSLTGVLSVLASTTVTEDHDVAFGPRPFSQCIGYVNSTVVMRTAEKNDWESDPTLTQALPKKPKAKGTEQ